MKQNKHGHFDVSRFQIALRDAVNQAATKREKSIQEAIVLLQREGFVVSRPEGWTLH